MYRLLALWLCTFALPALSFNATGTLKTATGSSAEALNASGRAEFAAGRYYTAKKLFERALQLPLQTRPATQRS